MEVHAPRDDETGRAPGPRTRKRFNSGVGARGGVRLAPLASPRAQRITASTSIVSNTPNAHGDGAWTCMSIYLFTTTSVSVYKFYAYT